MQTCDFVHRFIVTTFTLILILLILFVANSAVSCIFPTDDYVFDMCSEGDYETNRNTYLIYRGGTEEATTGTCRCTMTTEKRYIWLNTLEVRLEARQTHKCRGVILSWGQGNSTDGALGCSNPNNLVLSSRLYNANKAMWVKLSMDQHSPAIVWLQVGRLNPGIYLVNIRLVITT